MEIGAISFQPYIYNTNSLSKASLGKVSPISDDLLSQKTDFSGLASSEENINPLKKGETLHFDDLLEMQMQSGRNNAERIFGGAEDNLTVSENAAESMDDLLMQDIQTEETPISNAVTNSPLTENVSDVTSGVNILELVQGMREGTKTGMEQMNQMQSQQMTSGSSLYKMRQAAQAYSVYMAG